MVTIMQNGYKICHTPDCDHLAWWTLKLLSKNQPTKAELKNRELSQDTIDELTAPQELHLCNPCKSSYMRGLNTLELITFMEI